MQKHVKPSDTPQNDHVWGAAAIGAEIGRTAAQVHYLASHGLLGDAVVKVSHKLLLGSRSKLRDLTTILNAKTQ
jgi:hypothetical protein